MERHHRLVEEYKTPALSEPALADPKGVVADLRDVLSRHALPPTVRYAVSVLLLAEEVQGALSAPLSTRTQFFVSGLLQELRAAAGEIRVGEPQ